MAYKFKRKETATKALRRICASRVEDSLTHLKERDTLKAVHEVRKEIKKIRALLRLMESGMRRSDFCDAWRSLKDAAGHFASARDAHVTSQALGILIQHYKGQLGPRPFADLRPGLRKPCEDEEKRLREKRTSERVTHLLSGVRKQVENMKLRQEGWPVLNAGIKRSYGDGRCAWKLALAQPLPENLHEWRKKAKQLGYQLRLFQPIWPEQLDAAVHELQALSDYLGDDHDLFMLKQAVQQKYIGHAPPGEIELLNRLIEQRQNELRRAATALGARFYAEKPSVFCRRLGDYWKIWCRRTVKTAGKKRKVGKLARSR